MDEQTFNIVLAVLGTIVTLLIGLFGWRITRYLPLLIILVDIAEQLAAQTETLEDDKIIADIRETLESLTPKDNEILTAEILLAPDDE